MATLLVLDCICYLVWPLLVLPSGRGIRRFVRKSRTSWQCQVLVHATTDDVDGICGLKLMLQQLLADLAGTGTNTQGDWTVGTMFPIIDDASISCPIMQLATYPTIYTICPNRHINRIRSN